MPNDLYARLGVDRDANADEIHRAFHEAASRTHPDVGGNVEAFIRVKHAHDVLVDRGRRARYDATGDAAEVTPDTSASNAMNMVAGMLDTALQQLGAIAAEQVDLLARIRGLIQQRQTAIHQQAATMKQTAATWDRLSARFHRRGKGENLMAGIALGKAAFARQMLKQCDAQLQQCADALKFLEGYTFTSEPVSTPQYSIPRGGRWPG